MRGAIAFVAVLLALAFVGASVLAEDSDATSYSITLSQSTGGYADGGAVFDYSNPVSAESGTYLTFTATPNSGYIFDHWEVNGSNRSSSNPWRYQVNSSDGSCTVSPVFTSSSYSTFYYVDLNDTVTGGTATSSPSLENTNQIEVGITIRFTATADTANHYYWGYWEIVGSNGTSVYSSNPLSYTVNSTDEDVTVTPYFYHSTAYSISLSAQTGGTATSNPDVTTNTFYYGDTVTLTATVTDNDYVWGGWYVGSSIISYSNPYTHTVTGSAAISAHFTYTPDVTYNVSLTESVTGGTASSPDISSTPTALSVGTSVTMTAYSNAGYAFDHWARNGLNISSDNPYTYTVGMFAGDSVFAPVFTTDGVVKWDNGEQNGSVTIAFHYPSSGGKKHTMEMALNTIPTTSRPSSSDFVASQYTLTVEVSHTSTATVKAIVKQNGTTRYTGTVNLGTWSDIAVGIDSLHGIVYAYTFSPSGELDFTDLTLQNQRTVLNYSSRISSQTVYQITHEESGTGAAPSFSVVSTTVFMNTYQSVMVDPVIDIDDYYPQYGAVRLNFYSFAIYGEWVTFNGIDFEVDGSEITVPYNDSWSGGKKIHTYAASGTKSVTYTLSNIYLSWDGSVCWLTFADKDFTVSLGTYEDKEVSFDGIWFFTTKLWSPVTTYEPSISFDWRNEFGTEQIVVLFVAALLVGFVALRIYFTGSLGFGSLAVMAGAVVLALFVVV